MTRRMAFKLPRAGFNLSLNPENLPIVPEAGNRSGSPKAFKLVYFSHDPERAPAAVLEKQQGTMA